MRRLVSLIIAGMLTVGLVVMLATPAGAKPRHHSHQTTRWEAVAATTFARGQADQLVAQLAKHGEPGFSVEPDGLLTYEVQREYGTHQEAAARVSALRAAGYHAYVEAS